MQRTMTGIRPLDWAEEFGFPEIIAELKNAGAKNGHEHQSPQKAARERPTTAVALERALQLLETTTAKFFSGSGCVSCHHQNWWPGRKVPRGEPDSL